MANSIFLFLGGLQVTGGGSVIIPTGGQLIVPEGTTQAPSIAYVGALNTGFWFPTAGSFVAVNKLGVAKMMWASAECYIGRDMALGFANTADANSGIDDCNFARGGTGIISMGNATPQTDFNRLCWGGLTSAFPSLKRSAATLQARLADDSTFAILECSQIQTNTAAAFCRSNTALTSTPGAGAGTITNAPTAGNPTKWIGINDNGTVRQIPCW